MYGTIARIHPRPGSREAMRALADEWETRRGHVAGSRATYMFEPDHNPYDKPTLFMIAIFDDEASYRANAADPEQDAWYRRMRELLEDDPDWMDGTFETD
jgi:quinol monooxygenase YgiN